MKYGLDIPTAGKYADARTLAELAAEAEGAGWDGFFIWDVLFSSNQASIPVVDPWIALAAIAACTQRIRIGAMLTPLSRRRPWQVARETVSLDHLSNGRLTFGAGSGYQALDFTPFGEEFDANIRAEKLEEGLEVLKGLWSGETFSFQGKHYQVNNAQMLPKPLQSPRIPIWLAGGWPRRKPLRRAAQWDGIQKAGGPMIGLPARITLLVVVCVPLLIVFFRVKIEDQVNTWSSIFSCDTSPVYTHHDFLIHIYQKLRRVFSVSSAYLCQFVADVAFRRCSIRDRTVLSEMQPNIEYGQTLRGSASPHLRALFIHLEDHSKQANEFLHEPHTASF